MSYVSNAVLCIDIMDDHGKPTLDALDLAFSFCDSRFTPVSAERSCKELEAPVFVAAFNYVSLADVIKALRSITWEHPKNIVLLWCDQPDERYRQVKVFE